MGAELEQEEPPHIPHVVVIPYGHTFLTWPAEDTAMTELIREVLNRPRLINTDDDTRYRAEEAQP